MAEPAAPQPTLEVPRKLKWFHHGFALVLITVIRLLNLTVRFRFHDRSGLIQPAETQPVGIIYCLWHNRLAVALRLAAYFHRQGRHTPLAGLVSASKDGGILSQILQAFGLTPVRGSSSRRGRQALRELTTLSRRGHDLVITPDGPRGPCYSAKEGVISLAQISGHAIVPLALNFSTKLTLKSWDRFQIPLPFSRCDVVFGKPLLVPRDADADTREQLRQELEAHLKAISVD